VLPLGAILGIEQYRHDPGDEYWGFTSWNDFFARRLADGARPDLSATNYHRWHSPVAGTIVRAFVTEGTYCSEAETEP
jgi:phosphatidylserine decarboxylase